MTLLCDALRPESGLPTAPSKAPRDVMRTMWWRLVMAGVAVLIVLCLGLLEIAADRASMSEHSTATVTSTDEPGQPWER
jgi:hypothetical protein